MKHLITFLSMILFTLSTPALATTYKHKVNSRDNLYNTDWAGNPYSEIWNSGCWQPYANALNTPGALDARAVKDRKGNVVDFSNGLISISAKGKVVDAGKKRTNANGYDWLFRGLYVYSLIGIWSSTTNSITAIGNAFFIGTKGDFFSPLEPAYLFLANNDGLFSDNTRHYKVTIDYSSNIAVPIPASIWFFASALLFFLGFSQQKRNSIY